MKELRSLHAVAIENMTSAGVPDVNCTLGWIELKWLRSWPVKDYTRVRIDHFTDVQREWLKKRRKRGGGAWLLLQCKREWMLFDGKIAADHIGGANRRQLEDLALWHSKTGFKKEELIACLESTKNS